MIVLLGHDTTLAGVLTECFAVAGQPIIAAAEWQDVPPETRVLASACLYAIAELSDEAQRAIDELRGRAPVLPLVLVTSNTRANRRRCAALRLDDLVWIENAQEELVPTIADVALDTTTVERFARVLGNQPGNDPRFVTAMVDACRSAPPVGSVADLARNAAACEQELRRKARSFFGGRPRAVSRFLAWVRLLCAYDLARRGTNVSRIAEALAIDESTVRRGIRELTGGSILELRTRSPRDLLRRALLDLRLLPPPTVGLSTLPPQMTAAGANRSATVDAGMRDEVA